MLSQKNIYKIIFVFVVLTSLSFFNIAAFGRFVKLIELSGIALIHFLLIIHIVYDRPLDNSKINFSLIILLVYLSAIISSFAAFAFHGQAFKITFWEQRDLYFYSFYFLLHFFKIKRNFIEQFFISIAFVISVLQILQIVVYPVEIFNVGVFEDRGTVRVFLPGQAYLMIAFFLLLQRMIDNFKPQKLILTLFIFSMFILRGGRFILFLVLFGTILMVLLSKRVKSKALVIFLLSLMMLPVFYIFQDIFLQLIEVTEKTKQIGDENIRIKAVRYFMFELFPNNFAYLTGNGAPNERSSYGQLINNLMKYQGYYTSDIGIIGNYIKYGLLFVFAVIGSFIVAFKKLKGMDLLYIKIFFLLTVITITMGGGYEKSDFIVFVTILFYLTDKSANQYELNKQYQEIKTE